MIYPVILAGGKSSRFKSRKTKVLHEILGKPVLFHIIDTLKNLNLNPIYVVSGKNHTELLKNLPEDVKLVEQKVPLGTGDAVRTVLDFIEDESEIIVLPGDAPLISAETIKFLIEKHEEEKNACTFLTAFLDDPTGYGRVVRKDKKPVRIVEEIDASEKERQIKEVNAGVYIFKTDILKDIILDIKPDNLKGEYYITDCIEILVSRGEKVNAYPLKTPEEMLGINTREDYEKVYKVMKERIIKKWMQRGITIQDKASTYIEVEVEIGRDTVIYPMVYLKGKTKIGENCEIGPFVVLENVDVSDGKIVRGPDYIKNKKI